MMSGIFARVRDVGHLGNVENLEAGIADRLGDDEPRFRPDGRLEAGEIARLDEGRGDAEARQRMRQEVDGAAIERGRRRRCGRLAPISVAMARCMAAMPLAVRDRADAVLERRQPFLEHRRRRVGDAGVDVAGALEVEQRGGMVGVLEDVGRCLVDRNGARAGDRIGVLAGMQAQCFESGRLRSGHDVLVGGPPILGRRAAPGNVAALAGSRRDGAGGV